MRMRWYSAMTCGVAVVVLALMTADGVMAQTGASPRGRLFGLKPPEREALPRPQAPGIVRPFAPLATTPGGPQGIARQRWSLSNMPTVVPDMAKNYAMRIWTPPSDRHYTMNILDVERIAPRVRRKLGN